MTTYPTVLERIDWVIIGGESGPKARPCNVDWVRTLVAQCKAVGVACFTKQLGADPRCSGEGRSLFTGDKVSIVNGPMLLNDKKGGDMAEWPEDLKVREFPK